MNTRLLKPKPSLKARQKVWKKVPGRNAKRMMLTMQPVIPRELIFCVRRTCLIV